LKAKSKDKGDYDLTRSFQDLKKSKQVEQDMQKQLQEAQQRTRAKEQVLLKQLEIFKIHGYTPERRALIALLQNTRRLLKKNHIGLKKVFICYSWEENREKTEELQTRLKTLRDDLMLVCHIVWLDLYNDAVSEAREGVDDCDNILVIGTPSLKNKLNADTTRSSPISMEIWSALKKHESRFGSVVAMIVEGNSASSLTENMSSLPALDFTTDQGYIKHMVGVKPDTGVVPLLYPVLRDSTNGFETEYEGILEVFSSEMEIAKKKHFYY